MKGIHHSTAAVMSREQRGVESLHIEMIISLDSSTVADKMIKSNQFNIYAGSQFDLYSSMLS